jgi:hypothetical protein
MRLKIDTSEIKFRVAALPAPRQESRENKTQRKTPDGRPIWTVRLTAIESSSNRTETIWVEVAGDEPKRQSRVCTRSSSTAASPSTQDCCC